MSATGSFAAGPALVGLVLSVAVLLWPGWAGRTGGAGPTRTRWQPPSDARAEQTSALRRWWGCRPRRARSSGSVDDRADHADVLAMALRAGAGPSAAERLAGQLVPGVTPTAESLLARAVVLSEDLGTPLLPAVEVCADVARREAATRRRHQAALSGVRTSMWLLTALPLVGPLGLALVGVDVGQTYAGSSVARLSVLVGLALTGAGWWTARAIVRRAVRPMTYQLVKVS